MQQLVGADPDDLERLAVRMDAASSNVDRIRSAVDVSVRRAPWNGRVADRFKADWSSQHAAALRAAAEFLTGASNSLRRNAEEQRNASGDPGSGRIRPADPTVCRVSPEDEIAYTRRQMQEELDRAPAWDHARRKRLEDFLAGDRQFLKYSDTPGDERIIEVHGDLSTAKKVIIHVPGIFTGLDDYRHGGSDDAEALYNSVKGRGDVVVISFADYDVPQNLVEAAGDHGAQTGAPQMQALVQRLHDDGFATGDISVVAHSYGSRVVGEAMKGGLDVGRVVALGSPGMGADSRAGLGSPNVDLYAGSAPTDYVDDGSLWVDGARFVSEAGRIIPGAGLSIAAGATADAYEGVHGPSPVDMAGVHRLDTGPAQGHLHYFQGRSLEHIIDAALDHPHGAGGGGGGGGGSAW